MKSYISRKLPLETRTTPMTFDCRDTNRSYQILLVRDFQYAAKGVARNQQLLIGRHHPDGNLRSADLARLPVVPLVRLRIDGDPEIAQAFADLCPDQRRVFADAAGE